MELSIEQRNILVQKVIMSNLDNKSKSDIVAILLENNNEIKIDLNKDLLNPRQDWSNQNCGKSITDC